MYTYTLVLQNLGCLEGQEFLLHRLYLYIVGEREWLDTPHPEHQDLQEPNEYRQSTGAEQRTINFVFRS